MCTLLLCTIYYINFTLHQSPNVLNLLLPLLKSTHPLRALAIAALPDDPFQMLFDSSYSHSTRREAAVLSSTIVLSNVLLQLPKGKYTQATDKGEIVFSTTEVLPNVPL